MSTQLNLDLDPDKPVRGVWDVPCPTCDAPRRVTCEEAGTFEHDWGEHDRFQANHDARRKAARRLMRQQKAERYGEDWHKAAPYYHPDE